MLTLALLLVQAAAPAPKPPRDIVVTARPLAATEQAWRECTARGCPPDQEIAAALAHAENLFVAGRYEDADVTLGRTAGRVSKHARRFPVLVGDLWRARSRVKEHRGVLEEARYAAGRSFFALRTGLGPNDPRVLAQRLELADHIVKDGFPEAALRTYDDVAECARSLGHTAVEGQALLRAAMLAIAWAQAMPELAPRARRLIARLIEPKNPALASLRSGGEFLLAVLDAERDEEALDRAIARLAETPGERPVLIHAPPVPVEWMRDEIGAGPRARSFRDFWVDIAFWIGADGAVRDVHVLRAGGPSRPGWVEMTAGLVRDRRYAALKLEPGSPGAFRVERVTWTQERIAEIGSRILRPSGIPVFVTTDLTVD